MKDKQQQQQQQPEEIRGTKRTQDTAGGELQDSFRKNFSH
jgi:hypothetical protein